MTQELPAGDALLTEEQQLALSKAIDQQYGAALMMTFVIQTLLSLATQYEWNGDDTEVLLARQLNRVADYFESHSDDIISALLEEEKP